jgi:hypothetical protein
MQHATCNPANPSSAEMHVNTSSPVFSAIIDVLFITQKSGERKNETRDPT